MKKNIFKIALITLFSLGSSPFIFAQETVPEITNTVDFNLTKSELVNSQSDNSGTWSYEISGKFTRSLDQEVDLILDSGTQQVLLCSYVAGGGNTFNINFPSCVAGKQITLKNGLSYQVYFVDGDGDIISDNKQLEKVPENTVNVGGVTINSKIAVFKNDKNFYEINGTVDETKNGNLVFSVAKEGSSTWNTIGFIEYKKGSFKIPADDSQISQTKNFDFGKYKLKITDVSGKVIGGIIDLPELVDITVNVPNQNNNNYQPFQYSDVQQKIINDGIVSKECGYNLKPGEGGRICGFADFISLIQRIIEYIFVLVLPIAAIVFAYAGFLFMTSGGDPAKRTAAKNAMTKLLIGVVVIMMAWLLVKVILNTLGVDKGFTMFLDI